MEATLELIACHHNRRFGKEGSEDWSCLIRSGCICCCYACVLLCRTGAVSVSAPAAGSVCSSTPLLLCVCGGGGDALLSAHWNYPPTGPPRERVLIGSFLHQVNTRCGMGYLKTGGAEESWG